MDWWKSVVNGTKILGDGATWVWNNTPVKYTLNYAANTAFYVLEQGLALREAIPALYSPQGWKFVEGMGAILFYDILPIVTINYFNDKLQSYARQVNQENQIATYAPFAVTLLSSTALVAHYGFRAFAGRQAPKLVLRTLTLDALAPNSFNAFKAKLPPAPTLCLEEECNYKRKFKGSLREPLLLAFNDVVLCLISFMPYIGEEISFILAIYFYGEYITRMATPERCERHKAMKSESVLALGLTYTATSKALDHALNLTVGMPPYLYLRTLRHLLLLLHINLAAHMTLPLVKPQKDTIPIDPLFLYERSTRFMIDVLFAGLMNRIPIDFKPPPGAKPFVPLSTVLKFLTKVLDSDLEQVHVPQPGFFRQMSKRLFPSIFQSPKNTVNDPVIKLFWPNIQKGILYTIEIVESTGKNVTPLTTGPKLLASGVKHTLPTVLNWRFGLPIKLSEFLLSLSKKEDFWEFVTALKLWLERNNVSYDIVLTKTKSSSFLHGQGKFIELPPAAKVNTPLPSADNLKSSKSLTVIDAKLLIPQKKPPSITANSLFSTKQRPQRKVPQNEMPENAADDKSLNKDLGACSNCLI